MSKQPIHLIMSRAQRAETGKAARVKTPLEAHADFGPAGSRDPVALLLRQAETRVPELVPIRHGRMLVSPFTFYRGAASVMAADLATTPSSGLLYGRLCGWTLARAHARAGDRVAISAYLGNSAKFDNAVADFAETYADQNDKDHASLAAAVADGRVEARTGI